MVSLTPEDLRMVIEAIHDSITEYRHRAKVWEGRGRDKYFGQQVDKLADLRQRLEEIEEGWLG